jgi:hypothetical protein
MSRFISGPRKSGRETCESVDPSLISSISHGRRARCLKKLAVIRFGDDGPFKKFKGHGDDGRTGFLTADLSWIPRPRFLNRGLSCLATNGNRNNHLYGRFIGQVADEMPHQSENAAVKRQLVLSSRHPEMPQRPTRLHQRSMTTIHCLFSPHRLVRPCYFADIHIPSLSVMSGRSR